VGIHLKGGTLVELEPASVEAGDLRIVDGRIVARALALAPEPDDEVIELGGKVVMPGLVSAHHHLWSSLLCGAPRDGQGFEHEARARERLQDSLGPDELQAAATAGALEGLFAGTTTVFDVHGAKAVSGALAKIAHALNDVGLRGVLGLEISDRSGAVAREEALEETSAFIARGRGRFRGAVGLGSLATTSDEALQGARDVATKHAALVQCALAEDRAEEAKAVEKFGKPPVQRLLDLGLVSDRAVISQLVHTSWPDLATLLQFGPWLAHAPRSNMASQTGLATPAKFGVHGCLATDVMPLDVLAEAQAAWLRTRDSGLPIDPLRFLANGHRLASTAFGATIGPLQTGAVADLLVLDAQLATPLTAATLGAQLIGGQLGRHVESVMIDGVWRLWKRRPLAVDPAEVAKNAREAAKTAWARMR